jgi:hypothetical protein
MTHPPIESSASRPTRFLTLRELSAESGLHPTTILKLVLEGKLPAMKWGKGKSVWRIARKDWEAFLRERERKAHQELHPAIRWRGRG